jgi:hypothetical protein
LHILGEIFDYRKIEGKSRREQKTLVLILLWICTLNISHRTNTVQSVPKIH